MSRLTPQENLSQSRKGNWKGLPDDSQVSTYPVSSKSLWGGSGAMLVPPSIGHGYKYSKRTVWLPRQWQCGENIKSAGGHEPQCKWQWNNPRYQLLFGLDVPILTPTVPLRRHSTHFPEKLQAFTWELCYHRQLGTLRLSLWLVKA